MYAELAEMGHADGMCGLAMCLSDGTGGPPDMERAIELWRGAVEAHNHDEALYQLGCAYYEGTGVAEDEAEACALWRRAAAQKHRDASYMLGDSLLEGSGCKRDRVEAIPTVLGREISRSRASRCSARRRKAAGKSRMTTLSGPAKCWNTSST